MQLSQHELALIEEMNTVANALFVKNFFGIFHGSLSAKISDSYFLINKRKIILDHLNPTCMMKVYSKKDNRWNEASADTPVHLSIYQNLSAAKFIICCFPPFVTAYSLQHDTITPKDYWGSRSFKEISVHDPRDFETWQERSEAELIRLFKEKKSKIAVVRGCGIYGYARDLLELAHSVAILENSCKLLCLGDAKEREEQLW